MNNTTVKVVVQKVQVLAALPPQATDGSDPAADPSEVQPDVVAVLAVTPQQAEVIRFAQLDGTCVARAALAGRLRRRRSDHLRHHAPAIGRHLRRSAAGADHGSLTQEWTVESWRQRVTAT